MGLFRCGCSLLRSVYHGSSGGLAWWAVGIFWHGGTFFWVFSMLIGVSGGQIGVFLGVSGRFSGYFWSIMGFFGYFLGWSVYFLGIFDGLGFKSAAWVSNRRRGWWVWWSLLAPTGLCVARCVWSLLIAVCGSIDGLVVCVYVYGFVDGSSLFVCVDSCVWWCVWIGWSVHHGSLCVWLCVLNQCQRLREKERKKKMAVGKAKENVIQSRQSEKNG